MLRIKLVGLLLFIFLPMLAQKTVGERRISGKVVLSEAEGKAAGVEYANVSLLLLPDSSFVTGTTTAADGRFRLRFRPAEGAKYLLRASFMGCEPAFAAVSAGGDAEVGTLVLKEDVRRLNEVVVTALLPPVEQKGDTTVYNAEAYKIPQGAFLETLISRIPGLSYDMKTKVIKYKGEVISEITVNGKEFFKGNNKVALENLPADFVSRLRVYDKATEEEEVTGVKGHEKNYVLDLQTKKKLDGTLMASAEMGYGSKDKYEGRGQVFRFNEGGDNLGLVGSLGNRQFTTTYDGNRSGSIGGNISRKLGEKVQLSAHLNYGHNRNGNETSSRNELYRSGQNQYGVSAQNTVNLSNGLTSSANLVWNADSMTMFHLTAGGNFNRSEGRSEVRSAKFSENPELDLKRPFEGFDRTDRSIRMYESTQNNSSENNNRSYYLYASLIRKLRKEGNSIGLSYSSSQSWRSARAYKVFGTTFYQLKDVSGNDSVDFRNQYQDLPTRTGTHEVKTEYTLRLAPKDHLQFSYALNLQREREVQSTFDLSGFPGYDGLQTVLPEGYEQGFVDSLSNRRSSRTTRHQLSVGYTHEGEKWRVRSGLSAVPQRRSLSQYDGRVELDTVGTSVEWSSYASVQYLWGDNDLSLFYSGNTRQPSLYELMAPTVYHSGVYVSRSNPDLKAAYQHNLNLSFSNYNKGISAYVVCGQELNGISQATLYDPETGAMETYPVNISGNWNVSGSGNYEKRIGLFKLAGRAGGNYDHSVGLMNSDKGSALQKSVTHSSGVNSFLEVAYLPAWGSVSVNGNWDFQQFRNSLSSVQNGNTYMRSYAVGAMVSAQLPLSLQVDSDLACNFRSGTNVESGDENEYLWNVRLTWKFARKKCMELSALWADILNQRKSLRRTASSNGYYEYYTEQLRGYFMLSLKYRFNQAD